MGINAYLFSVASAVYATLSVLIIAQARQRANAVLAVCCAITALWAAAGAANGYQVLEGSTAFLDFTRVLAWYGYLLYLYYKSGTAPKIHLWGFTVVALAGLAVETFTSLIVPSAPASYTILSWPLLIHLVISISELLLIENLYFNLPESARWHIALPCILLASLACFDILVVADTSLFHKPSLLLESGRVIAMIIVAPLLVLAASRSQRWREPLRLSRTAVFHSATLVLSGSVLLSLALAGEILRHIDQTWGWLAELSLVFSGAVCILLVISSRSARSLIDQMVVYHFFADRYDYRRQWLSCIATLSGLGSVEDAGLYRRAIKAVADVVNSPCGALFVHDDKTGSMIWAHSWNMPSAKDFPPSHPLTLALIARQEVVDLGKADESVVHSEPLALLGPIWLAIPLRRSLKVNGLILVGPPRVPFRTDQEVFDLLGIVGQEVGTHVAEQQATEAVFQTKSLHDYGKRFSFVAHDIKNVSSQLALLLTNAEQHLHNPDFQQDMLGTIRASVQKIDRLLRRLDEPPSAEVPSSTDLVCHLQVLVASYRRAGRLGMKLRNDVARVSGVINPDSFDTALTHLINNALEASPTQEVEISVRNQGQQAIVEVADRGAGMSEAFIRDELFSPFKTKRIGGSGIGAFQARELIREAGGELIVLSQVGVGTTMRIVLKYVDTSLSPLPTHVVNLKVVGDVSG